MRCINTSCTQVRQSPTNVFLASMATADLLLIFVCLPLKVRWGAFLDLIKFNEMVFSL